MKNSKLILALLLMVPTLAFATDRPVFVGNPGSYFQVCSAAATNTADTAIKAAVTGNRIYVATLSCSNNSTVPSQVTFKDGSTAFYTGSLTALAVGGYWEVSLNIPLRGSINTALNFAMTTTSTATTCCATGYIASE